MIDSKDLDPCDTQCISPDNMSCSNIVIMHITLYMLAADLNLDYWTEKMP